MQRDREIEEELRRLREAKEATERLLTELQTIIERTERGQTGEKPTIYL